MPIYRTILDKLLMSLHRERKVVVHLYYSFQLRLLAVAWHCDKLESAMFLKFRNRIFAFLAHPVGNQLAIRARIMHICCGLAFLPVSVAFNRRCIVFLVKIIFAKTKLAYWSF